MIYRIVSYLRASERIAGQLIVPPSALAKVKKAAGVQLQDDGLGDYELDAAKTRQVAKLLGFRPEPDRFFYYLEPYDPPDDSGFQEPN
jgi:hypothetical protein